MEKSGLSRILNFFTNPMVLGAFFSIDVVIIRFYIFRKYYYIFEGDFKLIESFIEWFGVAYGLFIALVLVNVWKQFDDTEREFDREADAVFMLYQSVRQMGGANVKIRKLKADIIKSIKVYVAHVNQNYIREYEKIDVRDAGDRILEKIRDRIGEVIHTKEKEAITSALIKEFNDAVDVRGDRISASKQRVPSPVWVISLASSILWLIPFLWLDFKNDWIAIILEGGVVAIVTSILAIIRDLDDPFDGVWRIDTTEWELLGEKIGLKPTLILVFNVDNTYLHRLWVWLNRLFARNLCALSLLLNTVKQQNALHSALQSSVYLRVYYRDEFTELYEKNYRFPIVLKKSGYLPKQLIGKTELNKIVNLQTLIKKILRRL